MSKKKNIKNKKMNGDTIFALSVILVSVVLLAVIVYFGKEDPVEIAVEPVNISTDNQVTIGNPNAPVEVVKFFDFQCAHCQEWDASIFEDLNQKYIETGDVKFTLINFPFLGKPSEESALLFETIYGIAGSSEAFKFKDNVFANVKENKDKSIDAFYKKNLLKAAENSVTPEQYEQVVESFDNKDYSPAVDIDNEIAKNAKVLGTPAIYVNNTLVPNPFDTQALYAEIESHLNK